MGESACQLAQSIRRWGDNPPLQVLNLYDCSIPEDACCELISALFSCTCLRKLHLTGCDLCENGLHLKRYLGTITNTLQSLCLDGCSIPVDVMGQIMSVLSLCRNLKHMSLPGNTLTGTFLQFVPHPPLCELDLGDSALSKDDLNHLTALLQRRKLPNLFELWLVLFTRNVCIASMVNITYMMRVFWKLEGQMERNEHYIGLSDQFW